MTSVDLGQLFWTQWLDHRHLAESLPANDPGLGSDDETRLAQALDRQAVRDLPAAASILGAFSQTMPSAGDLLFSFRVVSRCVALASRRQQGFELHLVRGLVTNEFDQYSLSRILDEAARPDGSGVGRCLGELLDGLDLPEDSTVAVIGLRNDGELHQAILLASLLKRRRASITVILDASGANEQFAFVEWAPVFQRHADDLSKYVDYFLPRQDYKATLRTLVDSLAAGVHPRFSRDENVLSFVDQSRVDDSVVVDPPRVDQAFAHYIDTLPIFYTAGQRTIVGRLSPAKCHWAVCKFCTINSQHIMPRGQASFDDGYRKYFDALVRKVRRDAIESVVLMDEALHPKVLVSLARALLDAGTRIVYRARCRFTDELTAENCQLLYDSGCRYLGLGLESASPRVNRLVNKHMDRPIDYDRVLTNLEAARIRMHVYSILGFPTETREEITETRDFLLRNVKRFRYLTISANLFHLMKGSAIAAEPESFDIESVVDPGDVALVLGFVEQQRAQSQEFAEQSARKLYQAVFLPGLQEPKTAEAFWHFIDQTGIFYVQKVVHPKNPYHELAEGRVRPTPSDLLARRYESSHLFWIDNPADAGHGALCDWATMNYVQMPQWLRDFLLALDPEKSLGDNLEALPDARRRAEVADSFSLLLGSGLFREKGWQAPHVCPPEAIFAE